MKEVVDMVETRGLSEDDWEHLALDVLGELAWKPLNGTAIAPGTGERASWDELLIVPRLRAAIANPPDQQPEAIKLVLEQMEIIAPEMAA